MSRSQRRPLRLYVGESESSERHASWLELFFDLVFVVAIAQLAHFLHDELTWAGIGGFAALFVPVWWLWIDFSYYADQFDVERGNYRLTMLGVMFGMIVLAMTIPNALHGGSAAFATIYTALRLVIIVLYLQAWRLVPQSRELTARYTISFSIAFVFWLISIVVPEPARFALWGIALFIEISNGPITYGIVATGVGIQSAIEAATKGSLTIEARAVLCGGLAVFLLGLSAVQWAAPRSLPGQIIRVRVLAACCCAVLVWLGSFLAPLVLTGVLTATLVGLVIFESSRLERLAA